MEPGPVSSHDTEPMSSTTLSRVRRTLTAPEPYLPQSSAHSMDELALPFPFEVAVPRYPSSHRTMPANHGLVTTATLETTSSYVDTGSLWEVPDDQDGPSSAVYQCIGPTENTLSENDGCVGTGTYEPELEEAVPADPELDLDPISTIDEAPRIYEDISPEIEEVQPVEPELEPVVEVYNQPRIQENMLHWDENADFIEPTDVINEQPRDLSPPSPPQTADPIETPERPPKRTKKNQKKKVKRGKTTSAVVRKTVESDVEDDVIWIDEKKSTPAIIDDTDASDDVLGLNDTDDLFNTSAVIHNIAPATMINPKLEVQPPIFTENTYKQDQQANPAPKKRGRKRKKTGQEDLSAQETLQQPEEPKSNATIEYDSHHVPPASPKPPFTPQQDIVNCQTPEPNTDAHKLQTNTKSPDIDVGEEPEPPKPIETPKKQVSKGPDKHSPIAVTTKVAYRVGLSRKARIAPLLKIVRK